MDFKIPKFDELKDRLGIGEASSQAARAPRALAILAMTPSIMAIMANTASTILPITRWRTTRLLRASRVVAQARHV